MAIHNVTPAYTFEEWRVDYNNLSLEIGDFTSGITGSVPAGEPTYTSISDSLEGLVTDVNSIVDGTYEISFAYDLLPSTDNTFDLGSASNSWGDLFLDGDATIGGDVLVNGNITVNGQTTASEGFSIAVAIALG